MTPEFVSPDRLHDVWGWVRSGLEVVARRSKANWIPEDVYSALKAGGAHLYLIEDMGFIVLATSTEHRGKTLFVWAIHGNLRPVETELFDWLRSIRDKQGMKSVWWLSPRRWDSRPGVKLVQHMYELD